MNNVEIYDLLGLLAHNEVLQTHANGDILACLQMAWVYLNRAVQIHAVKDKTDSIVKVCKCGHEEIVHHTTRYEMGYGDIHDQCAACGCYGFQLKTGEQLNEL